MRDLHRLVEAAVQAPTGDNCQPWVFALSEGRLELGYDQQVAASVFNVRDVPTQLALGAAWENMALRASQLGLRLRGGFEPGDPPRLGFAVEQDDQAEVDPLAEKIFLRRTHRRPFRGGALGADAVRALKGCGRDVDEVAVLEGSAATALYPLVGRCDRLRWEHAPLIAELFGKIRVDPLGKYASRNGLAYDTLGTGAGALAMLRWLLQGRRAAQLGPLGLSRAMAMQTLLLLRNSAALVLLRCDPENSRSIVEAGRVMQRVWLQATALGVGLQPLASVPLLCLRAAWAEDQDFTPRHRTMLAELLQQWRQHTTAEGRYAVLAFRAGHARAVPAALRKPISAFVTRGEHDVS